MSVLTKSEIADMVAYSNHMSEISDLIFDEFSKFNNDIIMQIINSDTYIRCLLLDTTKKIEYEVVEFEDMYSSIYLNKVTFKQDGSVIYATFSYKPDILYLTVTEIYSILSELNLIETYKSPPNCSVLHLETQVDMNMEYDATKFNIYTWMLFGSPEYNTVKYKNGLYLDKPFIDVYYCDYESLCLAGFDYNRSGIDAVLMHYSEDWEQHNYLAEFMERCNKTLVIYNPYSFSQPVQNMLQKVYRAMGRSQNKGCKVYIVIGEMCMESNDSNDLNDSDDYKELVDIWKSKLEGLGAVVYNS